MEKEVVSKVHHGIFYTLTRTLTEEGLTEFTCSPNAYAVLQYEEGSTGAWQSSVVYLTDTPMPFKLNRYYITFGIPIQGTADMYLKISPLRPASQPLYQTAPQVVSCKAVNWYQMYNTTGEVLYIYTSRMTEAPYPFNPACTSPVYEKESDIILRAYENYRQIYYRNLSDTECSTLIPVDVLKSNVFRFSKNTKLDWMTAESYIWTGTLSLITDNRASGYVFSDGKNMFYYQPEHIRDLIPQMVHGKISGRFKYKGSSYGGNMIYLLMPVNEITPINTDLILPCSDDEGEEEVNR